jgi:hypothetical protein
VDIITGGDGSGPTGSAVGRVDRIEVKLVTLIISLQPFADDGTGS